MNGSYIALCLSVAVIMVSLFYFGVQSEMERDKHNAAMMKVCVESGGEWIKNFGPTWNCVRKEE